MEPTALSVALGVLLVIAAAASFVFGKRVGRTAELESQRASKSSSDEIAKRIVGEAEREADAARKSAVLAGKEELIKLREAWEVEARKRREEIEKEEKRLQDRELQLDRKVEALEQRDREVGRRASELGRKERTVTEREQELDKLVAEERRRLEQLAGLSAQEARTELVHRLEKEAEAEAANLVREIRETARRNAEQEA